MRMSRTAVAKSTIAVWRWLCDQPTAPNLVFDGGYNVILKALDGRGDVPNDSSLSDRINLMIALGLVRREFSAGGYAGNATTKLHLLVSVEDGVKAIGQHFAKGGYLKTAAKAARKNGAVEAPSVRAEALERAGAAPSVVKAERVAIRANDKGEPVEAIAGPDAPSPFEALRPLRKDEPAALVEAARQYENRQDFVLERLVEIEQLGVTIDREKVMKAIKLDRDDELEGVVKVLPYIEELEGRLKQAQGWREDRNSAISELKALRDEKNKLATELSRQKDANTRLAEKLATQHVTQAKGPVVLVGDRP